MGPSSGRGPGPGHLAVMEIVVQAISVARSERSAWNIGMVPVCQSINAPRRKSSAHSECAVNSKDMFVRAHCKALQYANSLVPFGNHHLITTAQQYCTAV
jgi:hypothetical protein